ncbi:MAG TPA: FAD-binding protein [Acidimicrobiia bacterium]|nr:FAD-binding protein [Acidimicrobiia bacterium]
MTYHPAHISRLEVQIPGAPESGLQIAPKTVRDVEAVVRYAAEREMTIQVWGGGTHSGYGSPPEPDFVMSMANLSDVEVWEPDDLTIVIGAGATVESTEAMLAERNQTLVMPEHPGAATIGGVISAGVSGLRRGRLYATRERVLEVTLITGDARRVRSGGRVVKNVTGYDLHRLAVGAFGSLGIVISVCLKLWPVPPGAVTVDIEEVDQAGAITRPLAILETRDGVQLFLQGTEAEVEGQAARVGGPAQPGLDWPEDPTDEWQWSLRVPPALTRTAIDRIAPDWRYLAIHGVGEIRLASPSSAGAAELRSWAESVGGNLVVTKGIPTEFDPWGSPPPGLALQRRIIEEFDPLRILNPGRLPGGL